MITYLTEKLDEIIEIARHLQAIERGRAIYRLAKEIRDEIAYVRIRKIKADYYALSMDSLKNRDIKTLRYIYASLPENLTKNYCSGGHCACSGFCNEFFTKEEYDLINKDSNYIVFEQGE